MRNHAAMHYAVNNKKLEVVKLLSNLGANVNIAGSGRNAMKLSSLHVAVSSSNYDERFMFGYCKVFNKCSEFQGQFTRL